MRINPIAVEIGPFAIHWYAICIVTGLLLAIWLTIREGKRFGIDSETVLDFILVAFPLAILGARLYYVIFEWSYYRQHLDQLFAIWNGGLAIYGGVLTGLLVLYLFCRRRGLSMISFMDVTVPGLMLAQSLGRWGNFFNQEAYGRAVTQLNGLPSWITQQMYIDGAYRLPTFLFESSWNLVGFIIVMSLRHRKAFFRQGEVAWFYLIWYGFGRFWIEGMRTDSLMFAGLRVSQWLSAILLILGIYLVYDGRKCHKRPYYVA